MTRRTNQAPKYRHYRPKDLAVVRIDGCDRYLGKYGSPESWEKYHRILAERAVSTHTSDDLRSPTVNGTGSVETTVAEVLLAFWKHAQLHYRHPDGSPSEELGNIKAALRPVRKLFALSQAAEFGPLALQAVRSEMIAAGLARTSINDRVNRIRRAFRWAASVELIPVAVVQALGTVGGLQKGRTLAKEPEPIGPVPLEVVEATLPHLSRPVAALVRLQLLTGMRPGEACAMRGRDLTQSGEVWVYRPESHKTAWRGKRREIPLGPRAVELIRGFLRADPDAFLFSPSEAVAEHHAKRSAARKTGRTPSELGKRVASPGSRRAERYRRNSYLGALVRACDKAFPHPSLSAIKPSKLDEAQRMELAAWRKGHRWSPNQLRHSVATTVRAKFGLEAAQVVLGHSKADITQVYAERDLSKASEIMFEIG